MSKESGHTFVNHVAEYSARVIATSTGIQRRRRSAVESRVNTCHLKVCCTTWRHRLSCIRRRASDTYIYTYVCAPGLWSLIIKLLFSFIIFYTSFSPLFLKRDKYLKNMKSTFKVNKMSKYTWNVRDLTYRLLIYFSFCLNLIC